MLVRILSIHILLTFRTTLASNYTIFYKHKSLQLSFVTINVTSSSGSNLDELSLDILYSPTSRPTVFLNHTICQTKCYVTLSLGMSALITFDNDDNNLISFYQFENDEIYLYYRGCYQPMDYLNCRYRRDSNFDLCICTNHLTKCTYDEPLSWDQIWCNKTTPPPKGSTITTTATASITPLTGSTSSSMTTKTHREIQVIANYSILYAKSFDVYCPFTDIVVNIIALLTPDDVMQVMFELPRHTTPCASFMVNNKKCQDMCVASMTDYGDHAILRFADDVGNEVLMIRDYDSTVQIRYDYCEQPMSAITCRFRQIADLLLCVCNGLNTGCDWRAPLLTSDNKCHDISTTSTTVGRTSATSAIITTATRSISTETKTRTTASDIPSTIASTQPFTVETTYSSALPTYSVTTATDFPETLKNLSELGVGKNNVSRVLNETLKYAGARNSLSSTEIQEITIILNNSANLDGLPAEDARNILLNIDCILSADSKNIKDGKSAGTLLSLLPTLVQHTNASQFDFLYGENFGFTARSIDCSSPTNNGLLDFGDIFKIFTGSMPLGDQHNSIYISIAEICRQQEVSHVYLTIYRNRKLFIGSKQYHSYDSGFTLAQEGAHFAINAKLSDGQAIGSDSETEDDVPSRCTRQIALPTESPVMSGTVLNNEKVISRLVDANAMTELRFNIKNILSPLHGRFRVTWWDTKKLEWSTRDQCETITKSDTVVARCQHLTDFTLIVDGKLDDPNVCDTTLMDLGYIASTLSVVSLTFLIFMNVCTYWPPLLSHRTFRYLRGSSPPHTDFVSLAHKIALLLFYVVFTIFSGRSVSGKACQVFGSLSYFLLMSSVLLTVFQAIRLTSMFCAIHPIIQVILLPSTSVTVSVLLPFTSSILLLVLTRFFNRGDCFCWVRPDYVVYAVIIPVSFLVLNATVCTFLVCRRLFGTSRTLGKSIRYTDQYLCSKIVAVVLMQVSLGMPWILQYFTLYAPYTTVWHYIFTIVMGSQGTMLVLLFLYKRSRSMPSDKRSQQSRITLTRDGTPSSRS